MAKFSSFRVSARRVSRFFPVKVKRIFLCTGFFKNLKLCSTVFILNQLILLANIRIILSVIRQKGESQNGCFKKKKHSDTHTYLCISEGKKYQFFAKFCVLSFLETPVLRIILLPYYRQCQRNCKNMRKNEKNVELLNFSLSRRVSPPK